MLYFHEPHLKVSDGIKSRDWSIFSHDCPTSVGECGASKLSTKDGGFEVSRKALY